MTKYEVQMMITFRGKVTMNAETEDEAVRKAEQHISSNPVECHPMAVEDIAAIHVEEVE